MACGNGSGREEVIPTVDVAALSRALTAPELQVYTVVVLARRDIAAGDVASALARLRTDADKLRAYDKNLYHMIMESAR